MFFVWYGTTRLVLETLRADNWTFFGVPTAQIISVAIILIGVGGLLYRHRRGHPDDPPPAFPQNATWGALGAEWMTRPIDEPWANVPPPRKPVDWDAIIDPDEDDEEAEVADAVEPEAPQIDGDADADEGRPPT